MSYLPSLALTKIAQLKPDDKGEPDDVVVVVVDDADDNTD